MTGASQPVAGASAQKLHILHIVPQLGSGGVELALARLIANPRLADMRHSVISMRGTGGAALFEPQVDLHLLQSRSNELMLPFRLARLIKRIGPTLIHARNWGAWLDTVLARLLLSRNVPLIYSFHGLSDPRQPRRRRLIQHVLARQTQLIFTVSTAARDLLSWTIGQDSDHIAVIPNGVDTHRFHPRPRENPAGRLVVGSVGNLTPVKNQRLLVEAFAQALARGLNAELHIAGEGPLMNDLRRQGRQLGISDRLHLPGKVEDIPRFLCNLDVFALYSLSEAHPNALLEAMACARACVCTNVGGMPEVLEDGRCGLLVAQDAAQAGQAIARLLGEPELRQELGRRARQRVCRCYSLDQMAEAYRRMYRSLVT